MAAANDGRMFDTPFNVVAGFSSREQAEGAARRLASAGLPATRVEVGSRPDAGGAVETAERAARMLRDLHADRVDLVDRAGTPLPPQHGAPRPADPEGYWWRQAGQG